MGVSPNGLNPHILLTNLAHAAARVEVIMKSVDECCDKHRVPYAQLSRRENHMGGMKPQNGVALSAVAVTLLLLTTSLNAEFQSAHNDDPFVRSPPIVRKADTLSVTSAQPGQYTAGTNGEFSAGQNISSDQRQQLCTAGVSTYASGRLHESALAKHATTGKHKDLWPLNNRDWWAFGIAAVAIFVAAGGGIGGGGILVPLYASVLGI